MKIALFGGSFDPFHNGHRLVIETVLQQKIVDDVWLVPCADHPFSKQLSPAATRLDALRTQTRLKISTYEIDSPGKSYSYRTLAHFARTYPEHQFFWLLGTDQVADFPRWNNWEKLLRTFSVLVYPRPGTESVELFPGMIRIVEVPESPLSSTKVRQAVKENQAFAQWVPESIAHFIRTQGLYV